MKHLLAIGLVVLAGISFRRPLPVPVTTEVPIQYGVQLPANLTVRGQADCDTVNVKFVFGSVIDTAVITMVTNQHSGCTSWAQHLLGGKGVQ